MDKFLKITNRITDNKILRKIFASRLFRYLILYPITILVILLTIAVTINNMLSSEIYRGKITNHFNGEVFSNLYTREQAQTYAESLYTNEDLEIVKNYEYSRNTENTRSRFWKSIFDRQDWTKVTNNITKPTQYATSGINITHIGHSSFLIQTKSINILADPIFSKRASPFSFIGPSRYTDPAINIQDIPKIDYIFISHNHYDHMDLNSIKYIQNKYPDLKIVTGLGNKKYLEDRNIKNIFELDWWEEITFDNIKVYSTPAQHFSARSISDRNRTLWTGFIIENLDNKNIYYSGDTAMAKIFEDIREWYKKDIDVAFLPIGAYYTKNIFGASHTSPLDALKIMKILKAKNGVAMHYGTFALAMDSQYQPTEYLKYLKTLKSYKAIPFNALELGKVLKIK